jgi:hypothetical protein
MPSHQDLDARSHAMHRLAADALRREPARFMRVQQAIERWLAQGHHASRPYLLIWKQVVDEGLDATIALATEASERATALRQSSPVTLVLTNEERFEFLRTWKTMSPSGGGVRHAAQ